MLDNERPWLNSYPEQLKNVAVNGTDLLALFDAAACKDSDAPAIHYFDGTLTYGELNVLSEKLATWFRSRDVAEGDRIAVVLQNVPQFVIGLIAAWKMGAIPVPINPMNRPRELEVIFGDCTPKVVICHPDKLEEIGSALTAGGDVAVIATNMHEFQARNDERIIKPAESFVGSGAVELTSILEAPALLEHVGFRTARETTALIVYTSGTSGLPKGALIAHGNIVAGAQVFKECCQLADGTPILGLAPLFHITGLTGQVATAFLLGSPLVLHYRFDTGVCLDAIREHKPQFMVGAITAFIAMMNAKSAKSDSFESLKTIVSGGAAVPPIIVESFENAFGRYIHQGYGLTESTPSTLVPSGLRAPIDEATNAISVGLPVPNTIIRIVDEEGNAVPCGENGEILIQGPQVVPGYWNKPSETSVSFVDGWLRTGDIGFMNAQGWVFVVDRKKDMINASGFKVWPREVEDVLYTHPAIREAAVVGVADQYRGETVKAVISLKVGAQIDLGEVDAFCRARMAAYKCPRIVEVIQELPKTATGKILRRQLRDVAG